MNFGKHCVKSKPNLYCLCLWSLADDDAISSRQWHCNQLNCKVQSKILCNTRHCDDYGSY